MAAEQSDQIQQLKQVLRQGPGQLVVITGPSAGAGKGKVISELLKLDGQHIWRSISMTTRPPRADDQPRHTYYFVSDETFARTEAAGGFLEANGVTEGHRYGTPLEPVLEHLRAGQVVLLEIEVEGGKFIHQLCPEALFVFIKADAGDIKANIAELRRRITGRGTNDEASIERRLSQAERELHQAEELTFYQSIVNATGHAEAAARAIYDLIQARAKLD